MTLSDIYASLESLPKKFPEFMSIMLALLIALGANLTETASQFYKWKKVEIRKKVAEMIIVSSIVSVIYYIDTKIWIPFVPLMYYLAWVFGVKAYEGIKEAWFAAFIGTIRTILFGLLKYVPPEEKKEDKKNP